MYWGCILPVKRLKGQRREKFKKIEFDFRPFVNTYTHTLNQAIEEVCADNITTNQSGCGTNWKIEKKMRKKQNYKKITTAYEMRQFSKGKFSMDDTSNVNSEDHRKLNDFDFR